MKGGECMKKEYIEPEIIELDINDITIMLRCSCSADDDNPY